MKKIISLIVVLAMALSCFGVTALANDKLPECNASLLKGDELIVADDVTLDFGMTFGAIDTAETVKESPYKDYLCDFVITFSEDVNAILAGQYDNYSPDWIVLKTEKGETFGDLDEFGYKFNKDEEVKVMSTAISALMNQGIIENPEEAVFTYEEIVNLVSEFKCGVKIVDEKAVDITLELCLFDPETNEKFVIGNPVIFNHEAAEAPKALITALTKDELEVKGYDLSFDDFSENLDFGMNFKALDTVEDLENNPYANYTVDFEIEFSEDVTAILAGQYDAWDEENWVAVKGEAGDYTNITEDGFSFDANTTVRVMKTAFETFPFTGSVPRISYREIVESIQDFNCGVKITSNKDVDITLKLCMYEIDEDGNETGFRYEVNEGMKFKYTAVSIPENADDDKVVEIVNGATSINDSNKDIVADAIVSLPPEKQEEVKAEVVDAVADQPVSVTDNGNIGAEVNTIENKNTDIKVVIDKQAPQEENTVVFDIDAYENTIHEDNKIDYVLDAPIVVKIPLIAFGADVTGITALYHEHDGELTKIDFVVKNGYVIFTMNKFSSIIANTTTLDDGEATLELVELTGVKEGTAAYEVVLKGDKFKTIQNFGAGEFVVTVNGDAKAEFKLNPVFAALNTRLYQYDDKYVIAIEDELKNIWSKDETYSENNSFVLGTITVTGWGKAGTIEVSDIIMNKHSESVINGGTDTTEIDVVNSIATADFDIAVPGRSLDVEVYLAHGVKNQEAPYQAMKVTVTKGGVVVDEAVLGKDVADFDTATNTYKVSFDLDLNAGYVVTVSGAGYRTASKNVALTEGKTVKFWNNILNGETNFLAGDIVGDDIIDIYDLSAVVSYFDQRPNNVFDESNYSNYDLNRDGVINSKDVVIVTNGWNN